MLIYDEWVVPGEVEYAEKKAAEIEMQILEYHKNLDTFLYRGVSLYIQITEHVVGEFNVNIPESVWSLPDIDVYNDAKLDWYQDTVAPIDLPKRFDLPAYDVRNSLPEWDESLLPESSRKDIIKEHSSRYNAVQKVEGMEGSYEYICRKFNISEVKFNRIMEVFIGKLRTVNKPVDFTELEKRIEESFRPYSSSYKPCEPWYFPLKMTEDDIVEAIREAYRNASKRSKDIFPCENDDANIHSRGFGYLSGCRTIENYEGLYQGRAGDLVIRFLFDFKNMKIVMAYPVLKEISNIHYNYIYRYNKKGKLFI